MVAERLTVADLATSLEEVLERVQHGEEFAIERDGKVIAEIVPRRKIPSGDLRELAMKLAVLPSLDKDVWLDIEKARAILLPAKAPQWPD